MPYKKPNVQVEKLTYLQYSVRKNESQYRIFMFLHDHGVALTNVIVPLSQRSAKSILKCMYGNACLVAKALFFLQC